MDSIQIRFTAEQFRFLQDTLHEVDKELTYLCDEDEHDGDDDIIEKRPENIKKLVKVKSLIITILQRLLTDCVSALE
mgnify:CR=1 FL=1